METSKQQTRVAVVGTGVMGHHHTRVYSQLKDVELIAVVDSDVNRAEVVARQFGCRSARDAEEIIASVDAVSVAVPTRLHASVAAPLLEAGIHCLIEKPIAHTLEDAELIATAARRGNALVQVGHIERFNPAVQQLKGLIGSQRVYAIEVRRQGPRPGRVIDVDVVLDLMIHDIDIVSDLLQAMPERVFAAGLGVDGEGGIDYAQALLTYPNGTVASLSASRITEEQIRKLCMNAEGMYVDLDYTTKHLTISRRSRLLLPEPTHYRLQAITERVFVPQAEPLAAQLESFIRAVRHSGEPVVGIPDGQRALRIALEVQRQITGCRPGIE